MMNLQPWVYVDETRYNKQVRRNKRIRFNLIATTVLSQSLNNTLDDDNRKFDGYVRTRK